MQREKGTSVVARPEPRRRVAALQVNQYRIQPMVVDHLARGSRKTAAKCESVCELQDTREHRQVERILRPRRTPGLGHCEGRFEGKSSALPAHGAFGLWPWLDATAWTERLWTPSSRGTKEALRGELCYVSTSQWADYAPNLSISFSAGKETNRDSPSNGERTGTSPAPNLLPVGFGEMWCSRGPLPADATGPSPP